MNFFFKTTPSSFLKFLSVLGLCCCGGFSLVAKSEGYSLVAVLQSKGSRACGLLKLQVLRQEHRLNSCGVQTSLLCGMWDIPRSRIEPRSPALWADSLPAKSQGKPKNTGVGNVYLLQRIFPTQGSNHGLLHCRQILYQLSYQGSPK